MRQWRVLLFFESLKDFSLACLSRINFKIEDDCTPIDFLKIPPRFFMQVHIFKQTFTLEITSPIQPRKQKPNDFTDALEILEEDSLQLKMCLVKPRRRTRAPAKAVRPQFEVDEDAKQNGFPIPLRYKVINLQKAKMYYLYTTELESLT
jgi:hypothetical protein